MDCIFCKIVNGEIPCYKIYEDDEFLIILDIKPGTNGDMLIITKKHYADFKVVPEEVFASANELAKKMVGLLEERMKCEGATVWYNYGFVPEVKHFHIHVTPRYVDDGFKAEYENSKLISLEEIHKLLT